MKNSIKLLLFGTLIGTLVSFFWGATEWFNPLLEEPYNTATNPTKLNEAMLAYMPENGIYTWPNGPETKTANGEAKDLVYFVAKQEAAFYNPAKFMLVQLMTQILIWLTITYLMIRFAPKSHAQRVQFVAFLALVVGLGYFLPMWNWWGFSTPYVLTRWLNLLIGWLLAGAAISFFLRKSFQKLNL